MKGRSKRLISLYLVAIVIFSVSLPVIAAGPSDQLTYSDDAKTPNPYLDVDTLTVAKHPMEQGTSTSAMEGYYDDSGDWVSNPQFVVNTTSDESDGTNVNPYSFKPGHIEADFFDEFPRRGDDETSDDGDETNQASAIDASEWSAVSNAGNMTVSDTTVAQNVDAVRFNADNTSEYTYNNWTSQLDSDESKRVAQLGFDLDSIDAGSRVVVKLEDESGDHKQLLIEPDASSRDVNASVMATATGDHVYQVGLDQLTTNGGGSWDNIESLNVSVEGGAADLSVSWIDVEKKGRDVLGKKLVDNGDDDSDYDNTNTTYNATGRISVKSMDTLGSAFDSVTITDVQFPAKFPAAEMDGVEGEEDEYVVYWDDAGDYPNFDHVLNVSYRLHSPSAIDLSYSGVDLDFQQNLPSGRYITAGFEADVGEEANLSQASLTDQTGSLSGVDDIVNFKSGASGDTYYIASFEVKLTQDERDAIEGTDGSASEDAGGAAGQMEQENEGILSMIFGVPGMIVGSILAALGLQRRRNSG